MSEQSAFEKWNILAQKELKGKSPDELTKHTAENIPIQPVYSSEHLPNAFDGHAMPGIYPFVRGPYATMYTNRPWTIRQYAGSYVIDEHITLRRIDWPYPDKGLCHILESCTPR